MISDLRVAARAFARSRWSGASAVGKRFKLGQADAAEPWITVVGVAKDLKQFGVREGVTDGIYLPLAQSTPRTATIAMRTAGDPAALAAPARRAVNAIDRDLAVFSVVSMPEIIARSIWQPRLQAMLVSTFAVMALVLTAVGVYGVVSYSVAQRTREIGVRMALGAQPGAVVRLIVGQVVRLFCAGTVVGLVGAILTTELLRNLLFGVSTRDPATFVAVPLLLTAVAIVSCYIPARRASSVECARFYPTHSQLHCSVHNLPPVR